MQWLIDPGGYPFDAAAKQAEDMLMGYLTEVAAGAPPVKGAPPW